MATPLPCDEYFSLSNLEGSSLETEIGYSTLCVQNKLKAAVFISATIGFFLWFCLSVVLFVREYLRQEVDVEGEGVHPRHRDLL